MAWAIDAQLAPDVATNANPSVTTHAGPVAAGAVGVVEITNYGAGNVTGGTIGDGVNTYNLTVSSIANVAANGMKCTALTFTATAGLGVSITLSITYSAGPGSGNVQGAVTFTGGTVTEDTAGITGTTIVAGVWVTDSITTVTAGDLLVSYSALPAAGGTNTPTAPAADGGQDTFLAFQYDVQGAAGAATRGGTWSGANAAGNTGILALKVSAAAPPVNTVAPAVTGTTEQGQTLTCDGGTFTGTDGAITKTYQWCVDFFEDGNFAAIPGATLSTLLLDVSEVGSNVECIVTATDANGATPATSNVVGPITPPGASPPVCDILPVISGTARQGFVLTCDGGTFTGTDGAIVKTYQWYADTGGNLVFVAIGGATAATYLLAAGQVGDNVECVVTATDSNGATPATSNILGLVLGPVVPGTVGVYDQWPPNFNHTFDVPFGGVFR